jgi:CheY-like chemotaxis protein
VASLLVVDNEPDIRFLIRQMAEATGGALSVVGEASSGDEAIARWRELRPDAIVLDQRMPGASGLEVAAHILAEDPRQVIVLFTAFRDEAIQQGAAELGVRACVAKADLARLTAELLGHVAEDRGHDVSTRTREVDMSEQPDRGPRHLP